MYQRLELANVEDNTTMLSEAKTQHNKAKDKLDDFKKNAENHQEEEMLDYYDGIIEEGDTKEIVESRRKAVKNVKAKLRRNQSFHCLTKS